VLDAVVQYRFFMSTRSDFLAATSVSAVTFAATGAPAAAATGAILDEDAFRARIASGAKHRQAIGAPRVNDAAALQFAVNTLNGFQNGWKEPPANVQVAIVLFGSAVVLGLDDSAWRTYKLDEIVKRFQGDWLTADTSQGNPWSRAAAAAGPRGDRSIPALLARGVRIVICNTALGEVANRIVAAGTGAGNDAFAVQAHLRERSLAGTDIVPAGISSIAVLQENGYSYFSAAL
jgi:intracellular sulfur oxidation DsrE/DsrF family protein